MNTEGGSSYYLDLDNLKKKNEYSYVWMMTNNGTPTKGSLGDSFSDISFVEVYCGIPAKLRFLQATFFSEKRGKGSSLGNFNEAKPWLYPRPDTVQSNLISEVCGH